METRVRSFQFVTAPQHGSYLQGMETADGNILKDCWLLQHGSYLQGMETWGGAPSSGAATPAHGSYLQGMETGKQFKQEALASQARILPTRNGNCACAGSHSPVKGRTDPTYKEWKPTTFLGERPRDTSTDPTYKEWKLRCSKRLLSSAL